MQENRVRDNSFQFAISIVNIYQHLVGMKKKCVLSKQLLRSSTSVGAMIRESQYSGSTVDFKHKLAIAQKEINKSLYWIVLMKETDYINDEEFESTREDATERLKLLTTILEPTKAH